MSDKKVSEDDVDSTLQKIASDARFKEVSEQYENVGDAIKYTGSVTNNGLLKLIYTEAKRSADESMRLSRNIVKLNEQMKMMTDTIAAMMETQNNILSNLNLSNVLESPISSGGTKSPMGDSWYYRGIRLVSRYHVYTCIIFHLIDMVQVHMDVRSIYYPDSVDCEFKPMCNAVRLVCTEKCSSPHVEYKSKIDASGKDSQASNILFPIIASKSPNDSIIISESTLINISNAVTRPILQDVEWIRQRLCILDGILSAKQIDILKSIRNPVLKPGSEGELNWDPNVIKPRSSHPLVTNIMSFNASQKNMYIKARLEGNDIEKSCLRVINNTT